MRSGSGEAEYLEANGATPLYDALFQAAEILKENRDPESRPAIVLFSDGMDTISMHLQQMRCRRRRICSRQSTPSTPAPGKLPRNKGDGCWTILPRARED